MNTITTTLLREIEGAALDFWIEHNHLVATHRKVGGEIWLDCDDVEEEEHICSNPSCEVQLDESYYQECQNERYIGEVCPVYCCSGCDELDNTEDEDVCCVGCGERVCGFTEEPPHKDRKDEAVCDDCWVD